MPEPAESIASEFAFYCEACELEFSAAPDGTGYEQAACPHCGYGCVTKASIEEEKRRNPFRLERLLNAFWGIAGNAAAAPPRLGIAAIAVLIVCIAFTANARLSPLNLIMDTPVGTSIAWTIFIGGLIWSLPMGLFWRYRGLAFLVHPGEWIWVGLRLENACYVVHRYASEQGVLDPEDSPWDVISYALAGCVFALAGVIPPFSTCWRRFFLALSACFGLRLYLRWQLTLNLLFSSQALLCFSIGAAVFAVAQDAVRKVRRPWTHWVGVANSAVMAGVWIFTYWVYWIFFS